MRCHSWQRIFLYAVRIPAEKPRNTFKNKRNAGHGMTPNRMKRGQVFRRLFLRQNSFRLFQSVTRFRRGGLKKKFFERQIQPVQICFYD
jgi:hypothetical protein